MNWILALLKITLFTTTGVGAVRLIEEAVISEFIEVRGQHFLFEMGVSDTAKSAAHRFCDDHTQQQLYSVCVRCYAAKFGKIRRKAQL